LFILFFGLFANAFATTAFSIPAPADKVKKLSGTWEVVSQPGEGFKTNTFDGIVDAQNIYGLAVTVSFGLRFLGMADDPTTFVRVILVDNSTQIPREYLVYQKNYQELTLEEYNTPTQLTVESVCQETCLFQQPISSRYLTLRVEAKYGGITVSEISYIDAPVSDIDPVEVRRQQNAVVIEKLNEQDLGWIAGETSVSNLTYEEKKRLANLTDSNQELNLQGFEFYQGGVFELKSKDTTQSRRNPRASFLVNSFDWRNRHGKNWVTSVKDQNPCGSCGVFASTGALESVTNLYFNQLLNLDLAEQQVVSCSSNSGLGKSNCQENKGWLPEFILDSHFKQVGIVGESCLSYTATDSVCNLGCNEPLIKTSGQIGFGSSGYPKTEDTLRRMLIENGPISGGILSLGHAMTLVGFETDPKDGRTIWIFKNSWGTNWGAGSKGDRTDFNYGDKWGRYWQEGNAANGYVYIKVDVDNIEWTHAIQTPIISSNPAHQISCVDEDKDNYCNWGISRDKPATCPASCKVEKDCDDSDAKKGAFDARYDCPNTNNEPDPQPPVATFTISPLKGETPLLATLDASGSSDPDGSITSYTWSYVSNSSGGKEIPMITTADPKTTYTFTAAGQYTITLTVKDSQGLVSIDKKVITVTSGKESSTLPTLGKALAFNLQGTPVPVSAQFAGGISADGKIFSSDKAVTLSDYVTVSGAITPAIEHVGQLADVIAVGYYVREGSLVSDDAGVANCDPALVDSAAKGGYYMMKQRGDWYCSWVVKGSESDKNWCVSETEKNAVPRKRPETESEYFGLWDGNLQSLLAIDKVTLADYQPLATENDKVLYKGRFDAPGHVCFYFGYRLPDGTLVFNGEQTINVRIKP
jgi:C1A family cysteine protease